MSNSLRPHRRQPTRLPRPWDPSGKNTGVGCHFLLQCMKVKSESEAAQSCQTLRDPMDCGLPGSSIHGIFQARVLEWGAIALSARCSLATVNYLSNFLEVLSPTRLQLFTNEFLKITHQCHFVSSVSHGAESSCGQLWGSSHSSSDTLASSGYCNEVTDLYLPLGRRSCFMLGV